MKSDISDHRARTPRRDATENRAAILDSARLLLNRDPESSLEAIAAGAGLSRRAIYGHFATREDLVVELQASGSRRIIAALEPIDHDDSRVAIALIGARLWSEVENVRVMAQLAIRGPQRQLFAETLKPVRRKLRSIVERGIGAGELRGDIPAATLANLIEGAALSVLDEAIRADLPNAEGHRLVMLAGLGTAGLSWREATAIIEANPELLLAPGAATATSARNDARPDAQTAATAATETATTTAAATAAETLIEEKTS